MGYEGWEMRWMPDGWLDHPTTKRPVKQEAEDAWAD